MNNYKLTLSTCYGAVSMLMQAENESAVNVIAEVMENNHGDVTSTEIVEVSSAPEVSSEPVTTTDTTALMLTAEQASWLKGLMQNPIHTQYAAEDKIGRHMRKAIFKLL